MKQTKDIERYIRPRTVMQIASFIALCHVVGMAAMLAKFGFLVLAIYLLGAFIWLALIGLAFYKLDAYVGDVSE